MRLGHTNTRFGERAFCFCCRHWVGIDRAFLLFPPFNWVCLVLFSCFLMDSGWYSFVFTPFFHNTTTGKKNDMRPSTHSTKRSNKPSKTNSNGAFPLGGKFVLLTFATHWEKTNLPKSVSLFFLFFPLHREGVCAVLRHAQGGNSCVSLVTAWTSVFLCFSHEWVVLSSQ